MVKCVDCGFCGFYINLLTADGLHWQEMDRATRRAFASDRPHNPPGQTAGTGHWNHAGCNKELNEWAEWGGRAPSVDRLRTTLLDDRECVGFIDYRAGVSPAEHHSYDVTPDADDGPEYAYDVFLSHAAEDDEMAGVVAELLRGSGISVFCTHPGFPTGIWSDEVRAALEQSEHFWLLLTDRALDRSVYVHHEFGYFFGFNREKNPDLEASVVAKSLRYLLKSDDNRRPGMYQHIQDFPVENFEDPVLLARTIADEIGRQFTEPVEPIAAIPQERTHKATSAGALLIVEQEGIQIERNPNRADGVGWGIDVWNRGNADADQVRAHLASVIPFYEDEVVSRYRQPARPLHWPPTGTYGQIPANDFTRVDLLRYAPDVNRTDMPVAEWAYAQMEETARQDTAELTIGRPVLAKIRFAYGAMMPLVVVLHIDPAELSNQAIDMRDFDESAESPIALLYQGHDDPDLAQWRHSS